MSGILLAIYPYFAQSLLGREVYAFNHLVLFYPFVTAKGVGA